MDPSSKIGYRKLAEANKTIDNLADAADAYEALFKIDPRDIQVAINLSDVYLENDQYVKALRWADKAISLNGSSGEGYGQKGKVYYYGWDNSRQNPFTNDDRIIAKLAYEYFIKAESKGFRGLSKSDWLKENAKDVMYGKAQWFMAEDKVKRTRNISTVTSYYNWVTESLKPESSWK